MPSSPFGHPHAHSDCYATWYIEKKAKELAGKYGFAEDEVEDLQQELSLHLLRQWSQYDPSKSKPTTFIADLIDIRISEMIRDQRAQKRDAQRCVAFSEAGEAAEYGLMDGVRGQPEVSDQEQAELRTDCDTVLSKLSPDLRRTAELLQEMSPAAVARELGISEGTLWKRMARLREHFERAGYGDA